MGTEDTRSITITGEEAAMVEEYLDSLYTGEDLEYAENLMAAMETFAANGEYAWFLDQAKAVTDDIYEGLDLDVSDAIAATHSTLNFLMSIAFQVEGNYAQLFNLEDRDPRVLTLPLRVVFEYVQSTGPIFGIFLTHLARKNGGAGVPVVEENASPPEPDPFEAMLNELLAQVETVEEDIDVPSAEADEDTTEA